MPMLKDLRKKESLTQQELAELIGSTQAVISKYELGRRKIPLPIAECFRDVFNLTDRETLELMRRSA